jgi:hypothetical protein
MHSKLHALKLVWSKFTGRYKLGALAMGPNLTCFNVIPLLLEKFRGSHMDRDFPTPPPSGGYTPRFVADTPCYNTPLGPMSLDETLNMN